MTTKSCVWCLVDELRCFAISSASLPSPKDRTISLSFTGFVHRPFADRLPTSLFCEEMNEKSKHSSYALSADSMKHTTTYTSVASYLCSFLLTYYFHTLFLANLILPYLASFYFFLFT